jgi:hypothetical protein
MSENIKHVTIVERIFTMEITTFSNNLLIRSYCIDCLSKTKTQKRYKHMTAFPSLSTLRECCLCHKMTMNMATMTFDVTVNDVIYSHKEKTTLSNNTDDCYIQFHIENDLLYKLKKGSRQ